MLFAVFFIDIVRFKQDQIIENIQFHLVKINLELSIVL